VGQARTSSGGGTADVAGHDQADVKPFLDHLEELRGTLFRCLLALGLGMAVSVPFVPHILDLLQAPLISELGESAPALQSLEVTGAFSVAFRSSLWAGVLLAAPFIFFFIGRFVFPGLTDKERKLVLRSSGFAVGLFFLGVFLGYTIVLRTAVRLMYGMHGWLNIEAQWRVNDYVGFAVHLLLAFGLAFELPVVVLILGRLGIVTSRQMRERRPYVLVILLVTAMLLTPPDVVTQVAMAVPLYGLYELSLWIVWLWEKREARAS
jgi:sec-independent protein translocase protein TatC